MKSIMESLTDRLYLLVAMTVFSTILIMGEVFYDLVTLALVCTMGVLSWSVWKEYKSTGTVRATGFLARKTEVEQAGSEGDSCADAG